MVWWRKSSSLLERSTSSKSSRYVCYCVDRSFARQVVLATCLAILFVCVQFWFLRPLYRRGVEISEHPGTVGIADSSKANPGSLSDLQGYKSASALEAADAFFEVKSAEANAETEGASDYSSSDESKAEDFGAEAYDAKIASNINDLPKDGEEDEMEDGSVSALTEHLEGGDAEGEADSQDNGNDFTSGPQEGQVAALDASEGDDSADDSAADDLAADDLAADDSAADDGGMSSDDGPVNALRTAHQGPGRGAFTGYDGMRLDNEQEGTMGSVGQAGDEGTIGESLEDGASDAEVGAVFAGAEGGSTDATDGSASDGEGGEAEEGSLDGHGGSAGHYHPTHISDFSSNADVSPSVTGCAGQEKHRMCEFDGRLRSVGRNSGAPHVAMMKQLRHTDSHASNLLMLPTGDLLCAWFNGVEGGEEVDIVVSQLQHGSSEWTLPVVASRIRGRSQQNPVLWHDPATNTIHLVHTSQAAHLGQGTSDVRHVTSTNDGLTWSVPVVLFAEPGAFTRNQLLRSSTGSLLLPMYYTPEGYNAYSSHYSVLKESTAADFATWEEYIMSRPGDMLAQPTVVQARHGDFNNLVAFFRSRLGDYIYMSRSENEGKTWSRPTRTVLPNNNSGIQAALLSSGTIAIVFNNRGGGARYPLSIALSEDGGDSWPFVRDLETGTSGNVFAAGGEYSYPSILQDPHGMIHVTYTYKRETIKYVSVSEAWVRQGGTIGMHKGSLQSQQATRVSQLTRGYAVGARPG